MQCKEMLDGMLVLLGSHLGFAVCGEGKNCHANRGLQPCAYGERLLESATPPGAGLEPCWVWDGPFALCETGGRYSESP